MSLKANISIILQIHSFRNLALPHKARYALQVHLYQSKPTKNPAMPFNILQTQCKKRKNVSRQSYIEDHFFRSKKFNIQYQDQQIELNDCCEFKMNIEGFPSLNEGHIYLQFILIENSQCYFRQDMQQVVTFKQAERYSFRLQNIENGIIQYHEGQFCKTFISSFSFSLYLMITDYRFYPFANHSKSQSLKDKARQNISNISELMQWSKKYLKNWQNAEQIFYKKYVKTLRYNSVLLRSQLQQILRKNKQQVPLQIPKGQNRQLTVVSDKQFFQYVTNYEPEIVNQEILKMDIYQINQENFYFFREIGNFISKGNIDIKALKTRYKTQRKDLFGERLIRTLIFGKQITNKQQTSKLASKLRKKHKISELKIIDQHLFSQKENQHYALLEVNLPHSLKTKQYEESTAEQVLRELSDLKKAEAKQRQCYDERNMIIFFCHGFQATSYDMEMLKREINKMLPTALIHCSTHNEMDTQTDIAIMGKRLADEVVMTIHRNFEDPSEAIINFVGHSMGGIIARACLAKIPQFQNQLGFYFSLSTPHLGYLNGVDTMIKAGMWFVRKMNKIKSLDQLVMQDAEKLKDTFLYKLSQTGDLKKFRKIILLSSSEDSYVPWHSARICYSDENNNRGKLEKEMTDSILGDNIVHRIDINFDINSTKDLDSFIGRAAHIHLLTQQCILKLLNEGIPNLFDIRQL